MKIGLVTASFLPLVGGLEWKVHYLATEYVRNGHEVVVFAMRPNLSFKPVSIPIVPTYKLVRCSFPVHGVESLGINRYLFSHAISNEHSLKKFDILHCHPVTFPVDWALAFKKHANVPIVATTCGGDVQIVPELNYGNRLDPRLDWLVRRNLQIIDVVGSISSDIHRELVKLGTKARIVDIPNGVNWEQFQIPKSSLLHTILKVPPHDLIVLSVGRNHVVKGYEISVKAFHAECAKKKDIHYVIVGRDSSKLKPLIDSLDATENIHLIEQMPMASMPEIYHSADIFINASFVEGFSQVSVQALACGLPCIFTNVPGNSDAGANGVAKLVEAGNINDLADAISELLKNAKLRHQMAKRAFEAGKQYAWRAIAQQYLNIFEQITRN